MKITFIKTIVCIYLLAAVCAGVFADVRDENVDMYLVLDKSLSMVEEIDAVKNYVIDDLVENTLIEGDNFYVIAFYGKTERIEAEKIDTSNKASIISRINTIQADGSWTDIGNALDELRSWLAEQPVSDSGNMKYLLLLTDGIQEAPPGSIYHVNDMNIKSVNHEFLKNTREIKKKGWSIHVIGIGRDSDAREIAQALSGSYETMDLGTSASSGAGTAGSDSQAAPGTAVSGRQILATAGVTGAMSVTRIKTGGGTISLELESKNADYPMDINVSDIKFETEDGKYSLLEIQVLFTLGPDETKVVEFPVDKGDLNPGTYSGTVSFVFDSQYSFFPAVFDTEIKINSFFQNNLLWIILISLLFAGLVLFIILIIRNYAAKKNRGPGEKVSLL